MNRPLTKEERGKYSSYRIMDYARVVGVAPFGDSETTYLTTTRMIEKLLSAEAYWREAVKNATERGQNSHDDNHDCPFCGQTGIGHAPDCPWLLAQDPPTPLP